MNKYGALDKAIEITKEYARGGGERSPYLILEEVYDKLKKLAEDAAK